MSAATATEAKERPRLKVRYEEEIRAQLQSQLGCSNLMQVLRL